jgi:hypothetical protein
LTHDAPRQRMGGARRPFLAHEVIVTFLPRTPGSSSAGKQKAGAPDRGTAYYVVAPPATTCKRLALSVFAYSRWGFPFPTEALRALLTGSEGSVGSRIPLVEEGEFYTTGETAKILRLSTSRVRALAADRQLEAERDESGNGRFPAHAVHARMPERPAREAPDLDALDENRRLHERLEELQRLLGRMEGQRELQAMAESTLKEYLDRERQRADALELEAKRLRDELDKARLPWWRRWFGSETEDRL